MPLLHLAGAGRVLMVGPADFAASNDPEAVLTTRDLGAGAGLALYDPVARIGGLMHAPLPDPAKRGEKTGAKPALHARQGAEALLAAARRLGAQKERLVIQVAGGARFLDSPAAFDLGRQCIEAITGFLLANSLAAGASQTGGCEDRSLYLLMSSGEIGVVPSGRAKALKLC